MHQTEQNENFEVDNYEAIDNQNNNQIWFILGMQNTFQH